MSDSDGGDLMSDSDDGQLMSDSDDEKKDIETGTLNEKGITCQFCKHQLLETESEIVLGCNHVLCPNCFNFFKSQNRKSCPICFKAVSNFDKNDK